MAFMVIVSAGGTMWNDTNKDAESVLGCMACNAGNTNWVQEHQQAACAFGDLGFIGLKDVQDEGLATVVVGSDRPRVSRGAVGGTLHSRVVVVEQVDKWWSEKIPGGGIGADVLAADLMQVITQHATRAVTELAGVSQSEYPPTQWTVTMAMQMNTSARVREVMTACNASCGGAWTGPVAKVWVTGANMPRVAATVVESWTWDNPGISAASTVDDIPWLLDTETSPVLYPAQWGLDETLAWVGSGSGVSQLQSVLVVRCARRNPGVVCGPLAQKRGQAWGARGSVWTSRCVQSGEAASVTGVPPCTCGLDTTGTSTQATPSTSAATTQLQKTQTWRLALGAPLAPPCTHPPTAKAGPPDATSTFPGPLRAVVVFSCASGYGQGATVSASGPTSALAQMNTSMPTVRQALRGRPEEGVPVLWVHGIAVPSLGTDPNVARDEAEAWSNTTVNDALGRGVALGWAGQSPPATIVPSLLAVSWAEGATHLHVTVVVGIHGAGVTGVGRVVRQVGASQRGIPGDTTNTVLVNHTKGVSWQSALPLARLAVEATETGAWNTAVLTGTQGGPCTLTPAGVQIESGEPSWGSVPFRVSGVGAIPNTSAPLYLTYPLDVTAAVPGVSPPAGGVGWHLLGHHLLLVPVFGVDQDPGSARTQAWEAEVRAMRVRYTTAVGSTTLPWVVHVLPGDLSVNAFVAQLVRSVVGMGAEFAPAGPRVVSWVPHVWSVITSVSVPTVALGAVVVDLWWADADHTQVVPRTSGQLTGPGLVATFGVGAGEGGGQLVDLRLVRRDAVFGPTGGLHALGQLRDGVVHTCAPGVGESTDGVAPPCGPLVGTWVGVPPAGLSLVDTLSPPWFTTECAYPVEGEDLGGPPGTCMLAVPGGVVYDVDPAAMEAAVLQAGIRCAEQDLGPLFLPEVQCAWGASSLAPLLLGSSVVAAVVCTDLAAEAGIVWGLPCVVACTRGLDPATNCSTCPAGTLPVSGGVCLPCAEAGWAVGCHPAGTARVVPGSPCTCVCNEGWVGANCTGCPVDGATGQPRVWAGGCVGTGDVCGPHGQWQPGESWPVEDPGNWTCVCAPGWSGPLCAQPPEVPCPAGSSLVPTTSSTGLPCQCDDVHRRGVDGACADCAPPLLSVDTGAGDTLCVELDACVGTGGTAFPDPGWCVFLGQAVDTEAACAPGHALGAVCLPCPAACVRAGGVCDPSAVLGCRCPWGAAFDPDLGCGRCPLAHRPTQGECVMCEPCATPWGVCGAAGECICGGNRSATSACLECLPGFAAATPGGPCVPCEGVGLRCGPMGACVVGPEGRADSCQCSGSTRNMCTEAEQVPGSGRGLSACCVHCAPEVSGGQCHVCTPECVGGMVCVNNGNGPVCVCAPPSVLRADGAVCVGPWMPMDPLVDCEVVFNLSQMVIDVCVCLLIALVCVSPLFLALIVSLYVF
jgi:hypothetical protein